MIQVMTGPELETLMNSPKLVYPKHEYIHLAPHLERIRELIMEVRALRQ